jgi:6-phosphogluconate dehydrogenase
LNKLSLSNNLLFLCSCIQSVVGMGNSEMSELFAKWNKGSLDSYLIEITTKILAKKDDKAGGFVVDKILDKTGMKGTGRWTVQEAAEQSVPGSVIASALDSRYISGRKTERVAASKILKGPTDELQNIDKNQIIADLESALYAAKVTSYAQGLGLIKAASDKHGWDIDLSLCASMWRGGCIIRAALLQKITNALAKNKDLPNLLVDADFAAEMNDRQMAWRRIVTLGVASGIATPGFSAGLTYYDQYRRESLPANLIQAQRDFFGGHTYERTDMDGTFHCLWDEGHKDIGDLTGRTAGEL